MSFVIRNYKDLGLRTDNVLSALVPYSLLTIVLVIGLNVFLNTIGSPLMSLWYQIYPSVLILVALSVAQEVFFRGYLMFVLRNIFNNAFIVILLNAVIFAASHLIFPFSEILILGAFVVGLGFATVYYYYPNLYLASTAHVILNIVVIPLCYLKLVSC